MTKHLSPEPRLEWFLASGFFAGGAASFAAAQVMFYVGNGNTFSFWLTAVVVSAVMAFFVGAADAIGGVLSWLVLRRVPTSMSRAARGVVAGAAMAVLSVLPTVILCLSSPTLRSWWPVAVAGSGASALCIGLVVTAAKVKPARPRPPSDRRVPGIRL